MYSGLMLIALILIALMVLGMTLPAVTTEIGNLFEAFFLKKPREIV